MFPHTVRNSQVMLVDQSMDHRRDRSAGEHRRYATGSEPSRRERPLTLDDLLEIHKLLMDRSPAARMLREEQTWIGGRGPSSMLDASAIALLIGGPNRGRVCSAALTQLRIRSS